MTFKLYLPNNRKQFLELHFQTINTLYNGVKQVYGPYNNSVDGRSRVVLYDGERRITRQFSKLKMEVKLNRRLGVDETVDHKDENFMNDDYSNLELLDRVTHIKRDVIRHKLKTVNCEWCNVPFEVSIHQAGFKDKAGPFCSRICTGKYASAVQKNQISPWKRNYKREYTNDKGEKLNPKFNK